MTVSAGAEDTHAATTIMRGCRILLFNATEDDPSGNFLAGVCAGTIDGLIYEVGMLKGSSAPAPHAHVFCVPAETTIEQQVRVVVKYIDAKPERIFAKAALCYPA